jgi:ABC-type thiamine transport system substrate-binding protein
MEKQIVTPEELQTLRNLQTKRDKLTIDFGYVEFQIQELELQKETLVDLLTQLKQEEIQVSQEITSKYGKGSVDLSNGEFTVMD